MFKKNKKYNVKLEVKSKEVTCKHNFDIEFEKTTIKIKLTNNFETNMEYPDKIKEHDKKCLKCKNYILCNKFRIYNFENVRQLDQTFLKYMLHEIYDMQFKCNHEIENNILIREKFNLKFDNLQIEEI